MVPLQAFALLPCKRTSAFRNPTKRLDVPVFLAAAEFENTPLHAYTAEFAYRIGMARGRMPRFMHMRGHNHTSIVAHFNSGEDTLGRELLDFVRNPR